MISSMQVETSCHSEVLGLIPDILFEAVQKAAGLDDFIPNVEEAYGFPTIEASGVFHGGDNTLRSKGDPDLTPLATYTFTAEPLRELTVYQYPYGFMAFVLPDSQFITRMD